MPPLHKPVVLIPGALASPATQRMFTVTSHGSQPVPDRLNRTDHAFMFDGVDDYLEIVLDHQLVTGAYTWVVTFDLLTAPYGTLPNPDGPPIPNDMALLSMHFRLGLLPGGTGCAYLSYTHNTDAGNWTIGCYSEKIEQGRYYQVATVYERGQLRLAINGAIREEAFNTPVPVWRGETLFVGRGQAASHPEFFNGVVDEVTLCTFAMTNQQLADYYKTSFR